MKTLFFILCLGLCQAAYAGDFEDALTVAAKGDYQTAYRLWRLLAEEGHTRAQYNLGLMYANGQGVTQDYIQAHTWFNLAASQGENNAEEASDRLAKKMTPDQISEAQALAKERAAKYNKE